MSVPLDPIVLRWVEQLYQRIDELRACNAEMEAALKGRKSKPAHPLLTSAELRVLVMVAQGYSDKEIASRYNISERTARNHMHFILDKLGLENRTQVAIYAWRTGIVCPNEAWETVMTTQWRRIPQGR